MPLIKEPEHCLSGRSGLPYENLSNDTFLGYSGLTSPTCMYKTETARFQYNTLHVRSQVEQVMDTVAVNQALNIAAQKPQPGLCLNTPEPSHHALVIPMRGRRRSVGGALSAFLLS